MGEHVLTGEDLIQPPPEPETITNRFLVVTQYSDGPEIRIRNIWVKGQRTLTPPVVLLIKRTNGERSEWPTCHHWVCQNLDEAVNVYEMRGFLDNLDIP